MKNKANAARKTQFHRLGPGGYTMALPKWDKSEQEMEDAGVTPVTRNWPPRCRTWFYAHGGALDPKTCEVSRKASLKGAEQKIIDAIEEARRGVFTPKRENDELTRTLGNPEHPGRTRGKGVIPQYEGFSDWNADYRTVRERRSRRRRRGRWRRSRESWTMNAFKA